MHEYPTFDDRIRNECASWIHAGIVDFPTFLLKQKGIPQVAFHASHAQSRVINFQRKPLEFAIARRLADSQRTAELRTETRTVQRAEVLRLGVQSNSNNYQSAVRTGLPRGENRLVLQSNGTRARDLLRPAARFAIHAAVNPNCIIKI